MAGRREKEVTFSRDEPLRLGSAPALPGGHAQPGASWQVRGAALGQEHVGN